MNADMVFVQGPMLAIDLVNPETGRSQINGETLEQVRLRYPGAEIADLHEWIRAKEKALCTEAVPSNEERFMQMLEVLPPQRWQRKTIDGVFCESFEMCEHTSGRVTAIHCAIGGKYFEFQGIAGATLAANVAHCQKGAL